MLFIGSIDFLKYSEINILRLIAELVQEAQSRKVQIARIILNISSFKTIKKENKY